MLVIWRLGTVAALGEMKKVLGRCVNEYAIARQPGHFFIAGVGNGNHARPLRPHVAQQLHRLLVTQDRGIEAAIDGGEHHKRHTVADQCIGPVFQFASRVAFGMHIGGLFQL